MKQLSIHLQKAHCSEPPIFEDKDDNRMESNCMRLCYSVLMPWPIRTKLKLVN